MGIWEMAIHALRARSSPHVQSASCARLFPISLSGRLIAGYVLNSCSRTKVELYSEGEFGFYVSDNLACEVLWSYESKARPFCSSVWCLSLRDDWSN